LAGIPSITVDNRSGMEAVVEHMILQHGCRRLAFLAGPPNNSDSKERLAAYKSVLDRNGIPFNPALVACANFVGSQTEMAVDELLRTGVPFDGIVAANDAMALGAIEALRKRGRRVPGEIAVTGFDDLLVARMGSPSLTSVAQPFEDIANMAVNTVVAQLSGLQVPERVSLPTRLVCRQSCGCNELKHSSAQSLVQRCGGPGHRGDLVCLETLQPRLQGELRTHADHSATVAAKLVDALAATVSGQPGAFRQAVSELLEEIGDHGERHQILREAINWLRDELIPLNDLDLERAFYEGLSQVMLSSLGTQYRQQIGVDDIHYRLRGVGGETSTAIDLSSLKQALGKSLVSAGIRTIFLSGAPSSTSNALVPLVCLVDGVPVEPAEQVLPSDQLVPSLALNLDNRRTYFVFPMALRSRLLGVVAVDYDDGVDAFGPFRSEIALVLRGIHLNQDLIQETMLRERSVQERQSTTKRMEALSVLAGGVAHDLNNALGPLVVLPDVILDELGQLPIPPEKLEDLRADVASIRSASQRAAQTIKDLLTLGRQGRITRQEVDLSGVVESCLATKSVRSANGSSRVGVVVDLCPEPLPMIGAESQLARAVGNLIRNAIEATPGNGKVRVKTERVELNTSVGSYENIPPGSYAVLTVSDHGCGIQPADLSRVFEPFFTTKPAGESSGSGLGLAIVHGVVKEHEGYIDVSSTPNVGTTFTLYFPVGQVSKPIVGQNKPLSHGNARILVVDDEEVQLETCRRVLARLGYHVELARSGFAAYDRFIKAAPSGKSPFDLVILDMVLGEKLDGLQVFGLIQRLFPAQKAIMASGHAPNERAEEAMKKGLPWLTKPYDRDTLAHAVESALAGR
jgi:signal transduction histidine kinase/ActR/RegA family two-component response regulator